MCVLRIPQRRLYRGPCVLKDPTQHGRHDADGDAVAASARSSSASRTAEGPATAVMANEEGKGVGHDKRGAVTQEVSTNERKRQTRRKGVVRDKREGRLSRRRARKSERGRQGGRRWYAIRERERQAGEERERAKEAHEADERAPRGEIERKKTVSERARKRRRKHEEELRGSQSERAREKERGAQRPAGPIRAERGAGMQNASGTAIRGRSRAYDATARCWAGDGQSGAANADIARGGPHIPLWPRPSIGW